MKSPLPGTTTYFQTASIFSLILLLLGTTTLPTVQAAASTPTTNSNNKNDATTTTTNHNYADELVDWLRSFSKQQPGAAGYFSDKIAFQPIDPTDPASPNGAFALQPIQQGERLIVIPKSAVIGGSGNMCDTARQLLTEYQKVLQQQQQDDDDGSSSSSSSSSSAYEPYVKYVFQAKQHDKLPVAWSQQAQNLFARMVGKELPPQDIAGFSFQEQCSSSSSTSQQQQLEEDAWRIVISRSWNDVLLPVYDMVNHRNGAWHNVDQATSAHSATDDVVVVALRDIKAGEQLYISYNECNDSDCYGLEHTYVLPAILKDYGFVEQYPRRWNLETAEGHELVFELDQVAPPGDAATNADAAELKLTWLGDHRPDMLDLNWLRGHYKRLQSLNETVRTEAAQLKASHEKETILEYYDALTTALEQAIFWASVDDEEDEKEEQCEVSATGDAGTCASSSRSSREYDTLEDVPDPLEYNIATCGAPGSKGEYEEIDADESQYQEITFEHNVENGDTCLRLSGWLQACTSFRPHYHEAFVHYPARFVDQVKRVIFFGGGDNFILHEILKYPSLELVVGMELDQQVVRSSFKNFGAQAHFDNPKVQWWFGDATKSLQMLPKEYYGTFDLVLVDLQTYVADFLMVTKDLSVMDVAVLLAKPDGVIARNEDFVRRRNVDFAKYTVDLEYHDVPILCQQSITMGSNAIDFLRATPKNLEVDSVYLKTRQDSFDGWYNYRTNVNRKCHQQKADSENKDTDEAIKLGLLTILELEDTASATDSPETLKTSVSQVLKKVGLNEVSVTASPSKDKKKDKNTLVFILQEGYVVARTWPHIRYCAMDILLWSNYDKQDAVEAELIAALGSMGGQSSVSSYRIVTGGMHGVDISTGESSKVGPSLLASCESSGEDSQVTAAEQRIINAVLLEMISLAQDHEPVIAVICGEKSSRCKSLDALSKNRKRIIPVWACAELDESLDGLFACESEVLSTLSESVAGRKLSVIVVDPDAPRAMGQILHKMLSSNKARKKLLSQSYVVLTPTTDLLSQSWHKALLERFRTEFAQFSPSYRTDVFFNTTTFELGIFSTGDATFYSHLADVITSIDKQTGLVSEVRNVQDGIINYIADFEPSKVVKLSDYKLGPSLEQWSTQSPLGHQTIFQFEIQPPKTPLAAGEKVLINLDENVWTGTWNPGRVVGEMDDGTYDVMFENRGNWVKINMERDLLRKFVTDTEESTSPIAAGERVLIRQGGTWYQGSVVEMKTNGLYEVQLYDPNGSVATVNRESLIRQMEASGTDELPQLSATKLNDVLKSALSSSVDVGKIDNMTVHDGIGDGCLITAFWAEGSAVLSWNGKTHFDLNFFTNSENFDVREDIVGKIFEDIPFLAAVSRDEQPRGFGRLVNFQFELESLNEELHWSRFV